MWRTGIVLTLMLITGCNQGAVVSKECKVVIGIEEVKTRVGVLPDDYRYYYKYYLGDSIGGDTVRIISTYKDMKALPHQPRYKVGDLVRE